MTVEIINADCMDYMREQPDNSFDIAVCDPPYGIGEDWKKNKHSNFYKHNSSYKNNIRPNSEYFSELFRISKNQIIWGGNYYTEHLPSSSGWIVWNKKKLFKKCNMAEGELAWHSFKVPLRIVDLIWNGFCTCEPRFGKHPHEKPISLYDWVLSNYAKEGDRILDTHLGSGSSAISAHYGGFDFVGTELDPDYYTAACQRFELQTAQTDMFAGASQ